MILTRIQIENYKQYQGKTEIEVPNQATIGVIGENGTGKTTLFEAIEWCLYSPRAISPSDVRPRGFTGPTTVSVYLESIDGTRQYIVQRVLKRTPSATIFRIDESGELETVVQGPKQVSDYVATKLIGLSHTAFTATFFTRQRELHLFGDQAPGKRREEVGRLLGLETIRTAQKSFVSERSKANADARAMTAQYAREADGRDFATEIKSAAAVIEDCTSALATSGIAIKETEATRERAEVALSHTQRRREQDASFEQQCRQLDQDRRALRGRLDQITNELAKISARSEERTRLAAIAATAETLRAEIEHQEQARSRFEQATELDRKRRDIANRRRDLNGTIRSTVEGIHLSRPIDGWLWATDDAVNPVAAATRLLGIIDSIDLASAERQEQALHAAFDAAKVATESEVVLQRYQEMRAEIVMEEQALLGNGEPRDAIPQLDRDREKLLHERTTLHANRTAIEGDRDKTRLILENLDRRQFGDDCPTCGRPFAESDAVVVSTALRQRADDMTSQIEANMVDTDAIERRIKGLDQRRQEIFAEIEKLDVVRKRIHKSVSVLETQQEAVDKAKDRLNRALAIAEIAGPPDENVVRVVQTTVRDYRNILGARKPIQSARQVFTTLLEDEESTIADRQRLGDVAFDAGAFQKLQLDFHAADRAQASIAQIDLDLARQPDLESERKANTARSSEMDILAASIAADRATLSYHHSELGAAQTALQQARDVERQALESFHRSQSTLREAELRHDAITREQERLQRLATAADARQSEADHLELMAKEFTEFERFAAARKVPVLGEYTSSLVRQITDGKYERVEFDQDFGIVVYDGEDAESSYSVDTFSGGERDAITLAARIALSQMIGRQAANPPGFLVLDEVFGSLDTDRRDHLLDLLGSISGTFDDLRQVFIISHVDDVRTSPVLDELWRVEETADGASQVTSLLPGAEIDSL